jgi:hypothetical protein
MNTGKQESLIQARRTRFGRTVLGIIVSAVIFSGARLIMA